MGTGREIIFSSSIDLTITNPPNKAGATLSGCSVKLEIPSPAIAYLISCFVDNGSPRSLFIPKTLPAAFDPLLPIPLPGIMFFFISISNPQFGFRSFIKFSADTVATFFFGSSGIGYP